MKRLALFLVPFAAFAAVDGTVTNKTTGKPQPGTPVLLMRLGAGGMQSAGIAKSDAQGKFHFDENIQGPHLVQVTFEGVNYNRMLPPGMPANDVQLEVYNASKRAPDAKLTQHIVFLEPNNGQLSVAETYFFNNTGNVSLFDAQNGSFRLYVPEGAQQTAVRATAPQGMPVERPAEKTAQKNVYMVDFAIKPGETRFDVTYSLPFNGTATYTGKVLYKDVETRIAVPQGVNLKGEGLTALGTEPSTNAPIFGIKTAEYKLDIDGAGSLQAAQQQASDDGPQITEILPRIYDNMLLIVIPALIALGLGFFLLYRKEAAVPAGSKRRG